MARPTWAQAAAKSDNDLLAIIASQQNADGTDAPLATELTGITAGVLRKDRVTRTSITCTNANTDYAAAAVIPSWATAIIVSAVNECIVQVDEATTAAIGALVPAATPTMFPIAFGASGGDSTVHCQSATAATVVSISYVAD